MAKFARGKFAMKHPEKYVGTKVPSFMNFCDNNRSIQKWASEAVQIPYKDPLTNRQTVYVPDFFIQYVDKNGRVSTELIEIKPASQSILERVGKNKYNQAQYIKNQAKWASANLWCKQQGIKFRILNENDIFSQV
jgi:hypothetical protein